MLNWHRKALKTTLAINKLLSEAAQHPYPYWYVGPSYGLAKKTVWEEERMFPSYCPDWHNPNSRILRKWETELRFKLYGGGQVYVFGADRPDLMRGPNPQGVILDEYAVMHKEVWDDVIHPIMIANPNAWCWFLFTPRGRNHAFDAYQRGLRGDDEWKSWKLDVYHSGIIVPEQIENSRRDMSEQTFSQEFMCEFLEGEGSVFRNVRAAMTATPESPQPNHLYVMGVDIAKVTDFTVLTVYDRINNSQVYQDRFQTLEWPFQKAKIASVAKHYNNALVILDATGIGDPIADDLIRSGVAVQPFKISEQSKKDLIEKLSIWIEQKKCRLIPMQETLLEFDNFSYEIGPTGKIRYQARDGFHDDIVLSHSLAINALYEINPKTITPEDTPVQRAFKRARSGQGITSDAEAGEWSAEESQW